MPRGVDAVILQEDIARSGDTIALTGEAPSPPGKHIRREGMDFRLGMKVTGVEKLKTKLKLSMEPAAGGEALVLLARLLRHRPHRVEFLAGDKIPIRHPAVNEALHRGFHLGLGPLRHAHRIGHQF